MAPNAHPADNCVSPPLGDGAIIPGGFFRWPDQCESPWRWAPLAQREATGKAIGAWVVWPMPEPEGPSRLQRVLRALRLSGDDDSDDAEQTDAAKTGSKDGKDDAKGDDETAAKSAADMYAKAIDRHRDALKWLVVTAGAVATAVIGTAPVSGLAQAIPEPGGGFAGAGFAVLIASLAAILVVVALVLRPAGTSTAELGSSPSIRGTWAEKKWLELIQARYSSDPAIFLDGKARDLTEYRDYRAAWLGVAADIDRAVLQEIHFSRSLKLKEYKELAEAQLRADDDSVSANIQRGTLEIIRQRATIAMRLVVFLIVCSIAGFLFYLYGIGVAGRPSIESLTVTPSEPTNGQNIVIRAVVTGDKLTFRWTHDKLLITPVDAGLYGAEGPVLHIDTADDADAGDYELTVTDDDNQADSETVHLEVAPPA